MKFSYDAYHPILSLQNNENCYRYTTSLNLQRMRINIQLKNIVEEYYHKIKNIPEKSARGTIYKLVGKTKQDEMELFFEIRAAIWDDGAKSECLIIYHEDADEFLDVISENSVEFFEIIGKFRDLNLVGSEKTFKRDQMQHPNFKSYIKGVNEISDVSRFIPNTVENIDAMYYPPCHVTDYDKSIVRFASENIDRVYYISINNENNQTQIILRLFHPRCYVLVISEQDSHRKGVYFARDLDSFIKYHLPHSTIDDDNLRGIMIRQMNRDLNYISFPPRIESREQNA